MPLQEERKKEKVKITDILKQRACGNSSLFLLNDFPEFLFQLSTEMYSLVSLFKSSHVYYSWVLKYIDNLNFLRNYGKLNLIYFCI